MNWLLLIIVGIAAIALIAFLVIRNQKDEKGFEKQLNDDYEKPKDEETDGDIEETVK